MIRVAKRQEAPTELKKKGYCCDEVNKALLDDQSNKCYICERLLDTDYQVEHLKSQKNNEELKNNWNNLFIACGYCNLKKSNNFDKIKSPDSYNVEEEIEQTIDAEKNKAVFVSNNTDEGIQTTIKLLDRVHNGTNNIRKLREERFFSSLKQNINNFYDLLLKYRTEKNQESKQAVLDELNISKEYLGFKFWIIKKDPKLYAEFKDTMVWNKKYD